jgi:hypothetical protein
VNRGTDSLQVQSFLAPYRDGTVDFEYNTDMARMVQGRPGPLPSYRIQSPSHLAGPFPPPTNYTVYRSQSSDYQASGKSARYMPGYGEEYNDDGSTSYTCSAPSYDSQYGMEPLGTSPHYSSNGPTRGWTPAAHPVKASASGMYFETEEQSYSPHFNTPSYAPRTFSADGSNNFSLTNMASSLPPQPLQSGSERMLPMPATTRTASAQGSLLHYSSNSLKMLTHVALQPDHLISGAHQPLNYVTLPPNAEAGDTYPVAGISGTIEHPNQDIYNPSSTWTAPAPPMMPETPSRAHNASPQLYYSDNNAGSRKASQAGESSLRTAVSNNNLYSYHSDTLPSRNASTEDVSHSTATTPHGSIYYHAETHPSRNGSTEDVSHSTATTPRGNLYTYHPETHTSRNASTADVSHTPAAGGVSDTTLYTFHSDNQPSRNASTDDLSHSTIATPRGNLYTYLSETHASRNASSEDVSHTPVAGPLLENTSYTVHLGGQVTRNACVEDVTTPEAAVTPMGPAHRPSNDSLRSNRSHQSSNSNSP